mgnify:CR=1 FL=1
MRQKTNVVKSRSGGERQQEEHVLEGRAKKQKTESDWIDCDVEFMT